MEIQPIVFDETDLAPVEIPVSLGKAQYALLEADEDTAGKFRTASAKNIKFDDGKMVGLGDIGATQSLLVSLCLYMADDEGKVPRLADGRPDNSKRVPESVVRKWKPKVVKQLFETAKDISDLSEGVDTEESIQKQIEVLQKRLKEVASKKKPSLTDGETTSA